MMKKKKNNKGFSLVELIVVIAIMAVLVGVLAPQFIGYVEKSRQSTDVSNFDTIKSTVEVYYADKDTLPSTVTITVNSGNFVVTANPATGTGTDVTTTIGVGGTAVKGNWTTPLSATWTVSTNTWTFAGESSAYTINASTGVATAK